MFDLMSMGRIILSIFIRETCSPAPGRSTSTETGRALRATQAGVWGGFQKAGRQPDS